MPANSPQDLADATDRQQGLECRAQPDPCLGRLLQPADYALQGAHHRQTALDRQRQLAIRQQPVDFIVHQALDVVGAGLYAQHKP
jgi:hypothetical protein